MSANRTVNVHILDKDYQVACPPDEEHALRDAARHLDQQMRRIREGGKVIGLERIAVMAALNITHELLQRDAQLKSSGGEDKEEIRRLNERLEEALHRFRQLEIG